MSSNSTYLGAGAAILAIGIGLGTYMNSSLQSVYRDATEIPLSGSKELPGQFEKVIETPLPTANLEPNKKANKKKKKTAPTESAPAIVNAAAEASSSKKKRQKKAKAEAEVGKEKEKVPTATEEIKPKKGQKKLKTTTANETTATGHILQEVDIPSEPEQPPTEQTPVLTMNYSYDSFEEFIDDDDGWDVVPIKSKVPPANKNVALKTPNASSSTPMTKKQRQNAARHAAEKAARQENEVERLANLAKHKKQIEKARIEELYGKKTAKKTISTASVSDTGKLVWD